MKFSSALVLLASASIASASTIRSAGAKRSLLAKSRRVEENQGDDAAEQNEYSFLEGYKVKLIGCASEEIYKNPESGEKEYGSVIYRLCPADDCDDDSAVGCKSGYGDYVVGLNSYVENWLEDKKEDMQQDDAFNLEEYAECRQYEVDNDADDGNQQQYYVGPTCSENGIKLGFFSDYTCTTVPEDVTFSDISNGWTLPYSDSLVSGYCESCAGYNDNGEYELSEMCMQLYQFSGKCETNMETTGYYGPDESACEYIETISPAKAGSGAGAAIGWVIFALVIVGAVGYGYTKWWMGRKSGMAGDGVMN